MSGIGVKTLLKIYTKTGDRGETGLLGGIRVVKSDASIEVCGQLDELNSFIGVVRSMQPSDQIDQYLNEIQIDLFDLGGAVAGFAGKIVTPTAVNAARIKTMETQIDELDQTLQPMTHFILPGGGPLGSQIHFCRSICRRVERHYVELLKTVEGPEVMNGLIYLNRLSDFLFVLARFANQQSGHGETKWVPGKA